MSNLLRDVLADVKSIRAVAEANAKATIKEAFQPTIQRIVSSRLAEEEGLEDEEPEVDINIDAEYDRGLSSFEDEFSADAPEDELPVEESEDDMELAELMRELDGMDSEEEPIMDEGEEENWQDPIPEGEEMDDEDAVYEALLREMDDEEEMVTESEDDGGSYTTTPPSREVNTENKKLRAQVAKLKKQVNESLLVVTTLKNTINEMNLLNAKLLYNTKVGRKFDLTKNQKVKVLEAFDRSQNVREVKLTYATLCEQLGNVAGKPSLRESHSRKVNPSLKPKSSGKDVLDVNRLQQLAKIKPFTD